MWPFGRQGGILIPINIVPPVWRACEKAPDKVMNPQNEGIRVGSKVVQVKGFMLLWQPKPEKHRPAKPFGDSEVT